jgi:hypothetical protein
MVLFTVLLSGQLSVECGMQLWAAVAHKDVGGCVHVLWYGAWLVNGLDITGTHNLLISPSFHFSISSLQSPVPHSPAFQYLCLSLSLHLSQCGSFLFLQQEIPILLADLSRTHISSLAFPALNKLSCLWE